MDAGGVFLPGNVHLVDVVGGVALQEGVVGVLFDTTRASQSVKLSSPFPLSAHCSSIRGLILAYHALLRCSSCISSSAIGRTVNDRERSPGRQVQIRPGSSRSIHLGTGRNGQVASTRSTGATAQQTAAGSLDRRSSQHGGVNVFFHLVRKRKVGAKLSGEKKGPVAML